MFGGKFNPGKYEALLDKVAAKGTCLFAVAPNVFDRTTMRGDPLATIERSKPWFPKMREHGLPAALVAQDGLEDHLDKIPWDDFDVLFFGGGDDFKEGYRGRGNADVPLIVQEDRRKWDKLLRATHEHHKHIHIGRVNGFRQLAFATAIGADSVDGNYIAFGPKKNLPKLLGWLEQLRDEERAERFKEIYPMENDFRRAHPNSRQFSDWLVEQVGKGLIRRENYAIRDSRRPYRPFPTTPKTSPGHLTASA